MRFLLTAAATLLCVQGASAQLNTGFSPLGRQFQSGYGSRPNLSPYLNLIRGGNTAANYYVGVRPEVQRRQDAARFSTDIADLNRRTAGTPESGPRGEPVTSGTYAYLANTGAYYNNTLDFFPTAGRPINSLQRPPATQPPTTGRRGASSGQPRPPR